jgi:thiaminase/transcriptional activator TenA
MATGSLAIVDVTELVTRHAELWRRASGHPFLDGVREGTLPDAAFRTWLAQDYHFVGDLLRFQARLLGRAPRFAQPVLAGGAVALVDELAWFEQWAGAAGVELTAPRRPATVGYAGLLERLDAAPFPVAITMLWTIERAYLDAWSHARPGAERYRAMVEHWTATGFGGYVDALAAAAAQEGDGRADLDGWFVEVVEAEIAFWDMAEEAP